MLWTATTVQPVPCSQRPPPKHKPVRRSPLEPERLPQGAINDNIGTNGGNRVNEDATWGGVTSSLSGLLDVSETANR